ncbi:LysR substrate-binding domain-containing protein [Nitratireductor sp. ZSWI3]|uniref:LysR substrate-binding domain-containing protein n=1 Tax=Nitratireductor sp. ZSWI3 TaxID=2966359 RepID=UPI00214FF77D|nr:LysR substrate-binding domain-containing protein [Nitratireductor sp. ZSWI3]MCR4266609.1 LysR substrate-binding domain-containing protein [Nitratireductor sp. ZSWI3]
MTFEQLQIFVAVAEREHLTRAAAAVGRTPSAVSSAIRALESYYGVELFHRVGRRIELTAVGRVFLGEARATLSRVRSAETMLSELGGLRRGALSIHASQTIASYWLPPVMMRFHERFPGIALTLTVGNTRMVAEAMLEGVAEVGLVEGEVDEPALSVRRVDRDVLSVVVAPGHPWADGRWLAPHELAEGTAWVMREEGSGTRTAFEAALRGLGVEPERLVVAMAFPSNEAVLSAVREGSCAAAVSMAAAGPLIEQGFLKVAGIRLAGRDFSLLRHKERRQSGASTAFEELCVEAGNVFQSAAGPHIFSRP